MLRQLRRLRVGEGWGIGKHKIGENGKGGGGRMSRFLNVEIQQSALTILEEVLEIFCWCFVTGR